ncbi:unnamed protein product [Lampetra planeri]
MELARHELALMHEVPNCDTLGLTAGAGRGTRRIWTPGGSEAPRAAFAPRGFIRGADDHGFLATCGAKEVQGACNCCTFGEKGALSSACECSLAGRQFCN